MFRDNQLGIQKITYTFPVVGAYSNAETTLSSIYENDSNNVAVVVNGENQTMGNGELDGNTGHWEFANKSELVNYVATDGVTVDEANILEPASEVGAGNTKYAVLKFVYDSDNFQDAYFLVKADISRGVVILPDSFWIGLSNNSTEYLTYFSDEQTMNFAYSESINYYASYFDAAPAAMNGLNGVTTFTMKDSSRYRFTESPSLSDKLETLENNYINLSINDESGVCDLSWKLNVLVVNQAKSYEITSVKEMSGDVAVSGDAKVVITSNTSSAIPNINLADMFEYKLGGVAVATEKLETNGNVAKITTTISSFTDDVAEVIANATVKNAFLNKVKINVSMNRLDTLDHTVSINKFEPITQTISNIDEGEYFGVSLNSIKNLPYMKTLNNYYDIVWKIGGTAYQEDIAIGSNVLVADLTPVNSFFVKDFDNENYKYTLSYDEANSQLKFVKQEREIMVSANWDENYTVLSSVSGVVTQIKITITFSSNRPLTLSNMLQVVQDTEIDDENFNPINYAEISSVSYDDDTIEIVVDVKDFLDDGQGNYSSFISIHLTKNVGYDRYVINRMDNFYSIEKNV